MYSQNVRKIKELAKKECKTGKETACSLLGVILYRDEKDISAIPTMEKYCFSYNSRVSSRCIDLFEFYLGQGDISSTPNTKKATEIARRCIDTGDYDSCVFFAVKFVEYPTDDPNITFSVISELIKASLKSQKLTSSVRDYLQFIDSCHISFAVEWEDRSASTTSHVSTWVRYKNLSKHPLQFRGELKARLATDQTKVFTNDLVGTTLKFERYLQPNELIRENVDFRVDDNKAKQWVSDLRLVSFNPVRLTFTSSGHKNIVDNTSAVKRICRFDITYEEGHSGVAPIKTDRSDRSVNFSSVLPG
nr:hypothetical protein HAGR004_05870 [Bdellovibrio sp. HAGR004]